MATIGVKSEAVAKGVYKHTWTSLASGDGGAVADVAGHEIMSVQVEGTFASGTTTIQGTNDKSNYATVTDLNGNNLAFTAAGLDSIQQSVLGVRPSNSSTASMAINVTVISRKS